MLKDKIENKIQLKKWVELTWVNLSNLDHETNKKNKKICAAEFLINQMLKDEIKKN
jgi:hypothetical protein